MRRGIRAGCFWGALLVSVAAWSADKPAAPSTFELDKAKQEAIWLAEHVTFKVEFHLGKVWKHAVKSGDASAFRKLFMEDAVLGAAAPRSPHTRSSTGVLEHRRAGSGPTPDTAVDHLLAGFSPFGKISEYKTHRLKVLQVQRVDETDWTATLLHDAIGADADGRPLEIQQIYSAGLRFDNADSIDAKSAVFTRMVFEEETLRQAGGWLFEEATESAGLDWLPLPDNWKLPAKQRREFRHQIAVEDFDRDGWLDLALATIEGHHMLLRGVPGGKFELAGTAMGIPSRPGLKKVLRYSFVAWIDYDDDGYPDLMMGQKFYRNEGGKKFVDVTAQTGIKIDRVPMGATVGDYDRDGDLDLYISYLKRFRKGVSEFRPWVGDVDSGGENALWRNNGDGTFSEVTEESGSSAWKRQTFASIYFYYDDDLHPDLYVANDFGENVLLRNKGDGTFEDITRGLGIGDYSTSMGVSAGDLDNDGENELYVANMFSKMGRRIIGHVGAEDYPEGVFEQIQGSCAGNRLYRKSGDRFQEQSVPAGVNEVGWAYAPAMTDLNGDGLLDLYATTGFMSYDPAEPDG